MLSVGEDIICISFVLEYYLVYIFLLSSISWSKLICRLVFVEFFFILVRNNKTDSSMWYTCTFIYSILCTHTWTYFRCKCAILSWYTCVMSQLYTDVPYGLWLWCTWLWCTLLCTNTSSDQFSLPDHMLKTCGLDSRPNQGILAQVCEPLDQPMRYHPFDYVRNKI